jgi:hypothetical protein
MIPRSEEEAEDRQGWHLDRHIPILVLITMATGLGGGAWWLSAIASNVDRNREDLISLRQTETRGAADSYEKLLRRIEVLEQRQAIVFDRLERAPTVLK